MSNSCSNLLSFNDDNGYAPSMAGNMQKPWKILIVDDDKDIHAMTKIVLSNYRFEGSKLDIYSVFSGEEAISFLTKEEDIALVLLDVVMETDDAGLICVKNIREQLKNSSIRIILRTGQPGQAPEEEVVAHYDINDYKAKTELTAQKLFTSVTASLRSYQHIKTIEHSRLGLEYIIRSSPQLLEFSSLPLLSMEALHQLTALLQMGNDRQSGDISSLSAVYDFKDDNYHVVTGSGDYSSSISSTLMEALEQETYSQFMSAQDHRQCSFTKDGYIGYFETYKGERFFLYLKLSTKISPVENDLISIFATHIASTLENISLSNEIKETQREIICTLSEVMEGRSEKASNHIKRISAVSTMLAKKLNLSDHDIEILQLAALMHYIGKIGTADSMFKDSGKLPRDAYQIMKRHPALGFSIFNSAKREVMVTAARVATLHHEKWNGTGYPNGLKGEEIHIFGRIVALADVVDALTHAHCYKKSWSMDKVLEVIQLERGQAFDPQLVDVFLASLDTYEGILARYPL